MWIERIAARDLEVAVAQRPVVLVTGARQTGKSSLIRRQFPDAAYATLDRPLQAEQAQESPESFLTSLAASGQAPAIIDETQYAPGIFRDIKVLVDADRRPGRFLLTGSQRFELMTGVSESLAGRVRLLTLETLSAAEIRDAELGTDTFLWRGGYPELWATPTLDASEFFADYISTYQERDLHQIIDVASLGDFNRLVRACALRAGSLVNFADLARDVGISPPTAKRWLRALEASSLIHLLPPYHANIGKRLTKAPKLYFSDHGLLAHLLNVRNGEDWAASPHRGALWENLVFGELIRQRRLRPGRDLFFYRDQNAVEVDFVIESGAGIELIEAKSAERPDRSRLPFTRVAPLFQGRNVTACLACQSPESHIIRLGGHTLVNPLLHDWSH